MLLMREGNGNKQHAVLCDCCLRVQAAVLADGEEDIPEGCVTHRRYAHLQGIAAGGQSRDLHALSPDRLLTDHTISGVQDINKERGDEVLQRPAAGVVHGLHPDGNPLCAGLIPCIGRRQRPGGHKAQRQRRAEQCREKADRAFMSHFSFLYHDRLLLSQNPRSHRGPAQYGRNYKLILSRFAAFFQLSASDRFKIPYKSRELTDTTLETSVLNCIIGGKT